MSNKLYVGNLSFSTKESNLEQAFAAFGEVKSVKIIKDRESGRSKGFGFVEFEDEANNEKAVAELDGKELDGRAINVTVARPREGKPREGGFRGSNDRGGNGGGSFRQRSW